MSTRCEQVASTLQRAVQQVIARGLQDPRIRGLVSVTGVEVSPDLRTARVLVSVLPAEYATLTMHGLQSAARHIQTEVGKVMRIRTMPRIEFRLDETLKRQAAVEQAIRSGLPDDGDVSDEASAADAREGDAQA